PTGTATRSLHDALPICVGGHVQHRDAGAGDHARKFLHDDVAQLEADLIGGKFSVGADDFGHEAAGISDAHGIGAEGADAHRAELDRKSTRLNSSHVKIA